MMAITYKKEFRLTDIQADVLISCLNGRKHTMGNSALSRLCRLNLIVITDATKLGKARSIRLTETGKIVAMNLQNEIQKKDD